MMSGGVASPYDPLDSLQYSPGEVAAAVEEAQAFGRYVCAHAYTPEAITRAMRGGVRTIEHGNLIDEPAARLMAEQGGEFLIRGEVMTPLEVIQSATTIAARVLRHEGKVGVIAPGAFADLLVVDGNPLE